MTPEFRRAIFAWRYEGSADASKGFAKEESIAFQLQKLFGFLQLGQKHQLRDVDTVGLTTSFGWNDSEVFQQQDVQVSYFLFNFLSKVLN